MMIPLSLAVHPVANAMLGTAVLAGSGDAGFITAPRLWIFFIPKLYNQFL